MRRGGSTAAFRTGRVIFASGSSSFNESRVVVLVLMRAVRDGVWIESVVRVSCRWSTLRWIGKAVVEKPVSAMHLIGLLPSKNVGPVVW